MNFSVIMDQWPAIATGLGGLAGAVPLSKWWDHQRAKRAQTDEVALGLVDKLTLRLDKVETGAAHEREVCEARLSAVRHELRNVAANFDGLLLALKYASPERIPEIVADVLSRRQAAIQPIPAEQPPAA